MAGESQASEVPIRAAATRRSVALETAETIPVATPEPNASPALLPESLQPESAKIIEFPRLYPEPAPSRFDELADPVIDQPRILEAPEFVPPPPALGGIILEPDEQEAERRLGLEVPLQVASIPRRVLAAMIDGVLVLAACVMFGGIFFWLTALVPPRPQILGMSVVIAAAFGAVYQFLLLTYTGSTPGLRLARLHLSRFDGSPVNRRLRRWRVAASILSGIALGLGFAWCLVDEDALCWHDRITRTYLVHE
jgi:uncharacterized RDD family membrane protein YckC